MSWVLIGLFAGSLIVSQHDTREACLGREAVLKELKAAATKCVELQHSLNFSFGSSAIWCLNANGGYGSCR
jgi:hypothetical protein